MHMHTYVNSYQEVTAIFLWFGWEQGGLFLMPGILFLQVEQNGQTKG